MTPERRRQILRLTLDGLISVGYDLVTLDGVATAAGASKATLYRHWSGKRDLLLDALVQAGEPPEIPDTGALRSDLDLYWNRLSDHDGARFRKALIAVASTMVIDSEFADAVRERVLEPRRRAALLMWRRAVERGELRIGSDVDLLEGAADALLDTDAVLTVQMGPSSVDRRAAMRGLVLRAARPPSTVGRND